MCDPDKFTTKILPTKFVAKPSIHFRLIHQHVFLISVGYESDGIRVV